MDTNQETGVSLQDVADLIEQDDQVVDESGEQEGAEEIADSDDSETSEDQPEEVAGDDSEEIDFEGKTYKVPKELKGALLRQSDYTQKTQQVAEERKLVEQRAQTLQQQEQLFAQSFDKRVELATLQKELDQYEKLDWRSLAENDPARATQLNIEYQQLQRKAGVKYQELQQVQAQNEQLTLQQRQQMLVMAKKDLEEKIPDFFKSQKPAEMIVNAARFYGISEQELKEISEIRPNAAYMHVLHDAAQWRALQAAKPKAMQKVAEAPKVIKPQAVQSQNAAKAKQTQALNARFRSGNARLNDLAAYLENS